MMTSVQLKHLPLSPSFLARNPDLRDVITEVPVEQPPPVDGPSSALPLYSTTEPRTSRRAATPTNNRLIDQFGEPQGEFIISFGHLLHGAK